MSNVCHAQAAGMERRRLREQARQEVGKLQTPQHNQRGSPEVSGNVIDGGGLWSADRRKPRTGGRMRDLALRVLSRVAGARRRVCHSRQRASEPFARRPV